MATSYESSAVSWSPEARYRLLVDAVTDYAIYMLDPKGFITSWNEGGHRLKGYSEAEALGLHFSAFYLPQDVEAGLPDRALAIAQREGRYSSEGWRVRKDGSRFWAHVVVDAIRDPRGALIGFAKVTRDLSERKAAEESLRRSEEQFRLLVDSVIDYAIYMIDPQGVITNWNSGAQRIKGYEAKEVIGTPFARFYPPEDQARGMPAQALATALRDGRFEAEGWRVRKDGTRFWASVVIDPIHDATGQHLGFAKVTRDVTEKRAAQQALEAAREELFQAQKLEAIGQLTGGVAHDFNNLLMVILSSLTLARRRLAPDQQGVLRLLHNAAKAARRGVSLTQRMLAFARRQPLSPTVVDLADLMSDMRELLKQSIGPVVELVVDVPRDLPKAMVDQHQLELAVLNLVVNARDAMPEGGRITVRAHAGPMTDLQGAAQPGVCLSVADTGSGMDDVTLTRATEPFFTTKGVGKGTGLGLPMVHGLAAQSGGELVLKSEVGVGTVAEIWLPTAQETGADPLAAPDGQDAESSLRLSTPVAILVVDDDPLVLDSAADMLEDQGHTVFRATSAEQALGMLTQGLHVDLVITDYAMPRMSGLDLIRALPTVRCHAPVILASGFAEAGADVGLELIQLNKPFTQEELNTAVEQAVRSEEPQLAAFMEASVGSAAGQPGLASHLP